MLQRERIVCAAVCIRLGELDTFVPVPNARLPMDVINEMLPHLQNKVLVRPRISAADIRAVTFSTLTYFVTNKGRAVDAEEAFTIALGANQLTDETARPPLTSQHLWPKK